MHSWKVRAMQELTGDNLDALFCNPVPAIRIPSFATPPECRAFAAADARLLRP